MFDLIDALFLFPSFFPLRSLFFFFLLLALASRKEQKNATWNGRQFRISPFFSSRAPLFFPPLLLSRGGDRRVVFVTTVLLSPLFGNAFFFSPFFFFPPPPPSLIAMRQDRAAQDAILFLPLSWPSLFSFPPFFFPITLCYHYPME